MVGRQPQTVRAADPLGRSPQQDARANSVTRGPNFRQRTPKIAG
jgi:hypothetical protein